MPKLGDAVQGEGGLLQAWSCFFDESGPFDIKSQALHAIGGLVVPMDAQQAGLWAANLITRGLAQAGAPWWQGGLHAVDFANPYKFAGRVRKMRDVGANVPKTLVELAEMPMFDSFGALNRTGKRLKEHGRGILTALTATCVDAIQTAGGGVVLLRQHATPWPDMPRPPTISYDGFVEAFVQQALVAVSASASGSFGLDVVQAQRGNEVAPSFGDWPDRVNRLADSAAVRSHAVDGGITWRKGDARTDPVLQLADLLIYTLGPRRLADKTCPPALASSLGRKALLTLLPHLSDTRLWHFGRGDPFEWLQSLYASDQSASRHAAVAQSIAATRRLGVPPPGNVLASVEQISIMLERFQPMGSCGGEP